MTSESLHLIKLAVGIESVEHLAAVQARRLADAGRSNGQPKLFHITRNVPRRAAELLDGGSIYWVIKGKIRVRQLLRAIESDNDEEGRRYCRLVLDPQLVETEPRPHRAIQGWRYLTADSTPGDLAVTGDAAALPPEMAAELRELGLL